MPEKERKNIVPEFAETDKQKRKTQNSKPKAKNKDKTDLPNKLEKPRKINRRTKSYGAIVLSLSCMFCCWISNASAQFASSLAWGIHYTDNAFQLSDNDLQENEEGNPAFDFVHSADDVIVKSSFYGEYHTFYQWWQIYPWTQINGTQYILNPAKQRLDFLGGIKVKRQFGEFGISYGYTPYVYVRDYKDNNGTGNRQEFRYAKNLFQAEMKIKPLNKTTLSMELNWEQRYHNKFFTEYDGDIITWTWGLRQSFPAFYADASYGYRVYDTDRSEGFTNAEDASYESNIFAGGLLLKKMPLDSRYPNIKWRPELNLKFENRYFQGSDTWHLCRTDNLNTTAATLHFYFGDRWNINLDYSHLFRNVDADNENVIQQKEFGEDRFGLNVRYQLY
ncbi:MAG TPA: hypothetical protein PKJ14_04480 [Candidatus Cloacimonadota bacterium]|nr:hypothetical protein [Candidatus Cloacimonadota bacterium]HQL14699.1 hypothetical protein [Candidatus Cloacimonadota bacterium]